MRLVLAAALVLAPALARGEGPSDAFFALVEDQCMPALARGALPAPSGMAPLAPDDPATAGLTFGLGTVFVGADPGLLIAFGTENGLARCAVAYSDAGPPGPAGGEIAAALRDWAHALAGQPGWSLLDNCDPGFPFAYKVVVGSTAPNANGHFLRILAFAEDTGGDAEAPPFPSFMVGETPEPSDVRCIDPERTP